MEITGTVGLAPLIVNRATPAARADRILANRWLAIVWRMWQDRKPYDEAYHLQQRALRRKPAT